MRLSGEVKEILRVARELADAAKHPLTTGHLMLALLTSPNRASAVLADLRINADRLMTALEAVKRSERRLEETEALLERVENRMIEAAHNTDAAMVTSLHLLLALTREKDSVVYRACALMGIPPVQVRTLALGRITGPLPRTGARPGPGGSAIVFKDEPTASVALAEPAPAPARERRTRRPPARPAALPAPLPALDVLPAPEPREGRVEPPPLALPPPLPAVARVLPTTLPAPDPQAAPKTPPAPPADDDPGAPYLLDPEQFPLLTGLGRNLSAEAARGTIDPVIGRERVIDSIIDVLNKRRSNNPCLVGEPGVGKTAIVEGLALAIAAHGERLAALRERIIISLDVGSLVAGTELRGSFSRRMAKLKDEVREAQGRVIVFIDELHTLVGAGSGEGPLDAANDLKAALARGEFPCIGATTPREYHRHIEKDPALERRFQPIEVEEPSEDEALLILKGIINKYEDHHGVLNTGEAVEAAVRLSRRYLVDRRLPDKAFNLVDTAAARAVRFGKEVVEVEDIAAVVTELTQIPVERLLLTDAERMLTLRDFLAARVIGHDEVLDQVTEVIQRNSAGFASRRPIGSFLFLGPSGVGKTETAKVLAEFLFCSKDAMTRFDMSEFMERHTVSRLLGAAPGYVGHEEAGQLTAALARRPYQIMLFDEVEKAHADVLNVLLQVLDEGHVTDAKGRHLSLSNTVIVMTSNLGAAVLNDRSRRRIGFGGAPSGEVSHRLEPSEIEAVLRDARKAMPPELWGRIDEKCVFAPLGEGEIARITRLLIAESSRRLLEERRISYEADDEVVAWLIRQAGVDPALGARPMRRAVQRHCETAVARALLRHEARSGDHLSLQLDEGQIIVVPAIA